MKVINRPIEVLLHIDEQGNVKPIRFRLKTEDGSYKVVKVNRICKKDMMKIAGCSTLRLTCILGIDDYERICELQYDCNAMKWVLFKI